MEQAVMESEQGVVGAPERPVFVIAKVRPDQLRGMWPVLEPWLKAALEHGMNLDAGALYAGALLDEIQLWAAFRDGRPVGAAATQVIDYGSGLSTVRVIALSGDDFGAWRGQIIDEFERFAQRVGAQTIECVGRRGWIRSLARYGFESKYAICVKEVAK